MIKAKNLLLITFEITEKKVVSVFLKIVIPDNIIYYSLGLITARLRTSDICAFDPIE